jgi:hypothetical protein
MERRYASIFRIEELAKQEAGCKKKLATED